MGIGRTLHFSCYAFARLSILQFTYREPQVSYEKSICHSTAIFRRCRATPGRLLTRKPRIHIFLYIHISKSGDMSPCKSAHVMISMNGREMTPGGRRAGGQESWGERIVLYFIEWRWEHESTKWHDLDFQPAIPFSFL